MAETYIDEIILKKKQEKKEERLKQYIQQQEALPEELFQTIRLGEDVAEIKLPIGLKPMPRELIEKKYQFDPAPQIVMTNRNGDVNFTFSVLDIEIPEAELFSGMEESMEGLRRYQPSIVFYDKGQKEIHGITACWFSYMNNSLDGHKIYNVVLYAATKRTLMMTMNCRYEHHEKWDVVTQLCMQSLTGKVCNE